MPILLWMAMLFALSSMAYAQEVRFTPVTFQNAATATGNGTTLPVDKYTSVGVQVVISDTATVTFEATSDGTNWVSKTCSSVDDTAATLVTTATASGVYQCNIAGLQLFRARISAYTAGTVTVTGRASTAIVSRGGSGGGAGTLDQAFDGGKTIDGANSLANAMCVGDGTRQICFYGDASLGSVIRSRNGGSDTDSTIRCWTNQNCTFYDVEGGATILTIDPDAASVNAMYQFGANYRPRKSIWFGAAALSTDGTQCAAPAEVTINSGPKLWTIICTDNDASTIYGSVKMPDSWDGGTVTFEHVYIQTAADTSALNGDIAAQCRGNGEAPSSTWGSEVALDDAAVTGSNQNDFTTSAAVTPAGTCAAGDMLYFRYQLDATGTTTAVATLHTLGFKMEYSVSSLSD